MKPHKANEEIHEKEAHSLLEVGMAAISKRPAFKRMITEARKQQVVTEYDKDGNEVSSHTEFVYSEAMRITTFSNVMVKAIVSGMNDRNSNSIYVPSYMGKMCLYKVPVSEDYNFLTCHDVVTDGNFDYAIMDMCLTDGKLTKEMLTGLSGFHVGSMIYEAIGEDRLYNMVSNSSNAVTTLSESLVHFIESYSPVDDLVCVTWEILKSGMCPADKYEGVVSGIAQHIKSAAKTAGIISNGESRSKVLPFLIGLRLKEMYPAHH